MKTTILTFFVLFMSFSYSQTALLSPSDFKQDNDRMVAYDLTRQMFNGENKQVDVKISIGVENEVFKNTPIEQITQMINEANLKSMNAVKNKYSYSARIIKLTYMPSRNDWSCTVEYTAQNDYGAMKTGLGSADFDDKGVLKKFNSF